MTEQSSKASSSSSSSSWLHRTRYSRTVYHQPGTISKISATWNPNTIPSPSSFPSSKPSNSSSSCKNSIVSSPPLCNSKDSDTTTTTTSTKNKKKKMMKKKNPLIQFSDIFNLRPKASSAKTSSSGKEKEGQVLGQEKSQEEGQDLGPDEGIQEEHNNINDGLDFSFPSAFSSSPISDTCSSLDHSVSSKVDRGNYNPSSYVEEDHADSCICSIPCNMAYNGDDIPTSSGDFPFSSISSESRSRSAFTTCTHPTFLQSVFNSLSLSSTRQCSEISFDDDGSSHGNNCIIPMSTNTSFNDRASPNHTSPRHIIGSLKKSSSWFSKISPIGSPKSQLSPHGSPKLNSPVASPKCSPQNSFRKSLSPKGSPRNSFRKTLNDGAKGLIQRVPSWSSFLSNSMGGEKAVLSSEIWMLDLSQLLLGERFACGNHSRLYRGVYKDTSVAVKVIRQPDDDSITADRLQQIFTQEVTMLSCLQHQRVVKFIAACKKPPVLCVVTEYLPCGSLRTFLSKRRGEILPLEDVVRIALDIACGMEYLHMKGVIHRDLKSENLVLAKDGSVKIVDFGVSRFESECNAREDDPGTYRWMAPEMLCLKPYSRKVDVYSFGIVLWELLTTLLPYEDLSAIQAAFLVSNKDIRPPIPSDCPPQLEVLMKQCWSTDPSTRPEFWEILRTLNLFQRSLDSGIVTFESPVHERYLPSWLASE